MNRGKGLLARLRGERSERLARGYLEARGLTFVDANVHSRGGEIDLVMHEGDTRVFVEVRYRSRADWGTAAASVTATKQRRLIRAAQYYLLKHPWPGPCRFDVLAVEAGDTVEWIRNAFEC
ncbi:MAG: YraN family protein [Ectothiorhodospiraceae bacterium]|nr:YraN family protein [Ectothiorhodospiraceae bacterium]MCH8503833.1 YraN family protein [Ectothiorhodospiraceae bacterium]